MARWVLVTAFVVSVMVVRESQAEGPQVWQQTTPEGQGVQALVLPAVRPADAVSPRVHALIVDTSASQLGEHRQHALQVLRALLDALPPQHRVRLFALDVQLEPLTEGWHAPQSAAVNAGYDALLRRVPLGATNVLAGFESLWSQLPADQPASVLYLGDGQSTAKHMTSEEFARLTAQARERRVSIHSYAVGPQWNLQLLSCLALHTGGTTSVDPQSARDQQVQQVATRLAGALTAAVWYPQQWELSPSDLSLLPAYPLPLRSDRETIYLSMGSWPAEVQLTISSTSARLQWQLPEPREQPGMAFLPVYTQRALHDQGLSNGLAGREVVALAQDDFQLHLLRMLHEGQLALLQNQPEKADQIVRTVQAWDRQLPQAQQLAAAVEAQKVSLKRQPADEAGAPDPALDRQPLLLQHEQEVRVREQRLWQELTQRIEQARQNRDAGMAHDDLKRFRTTIESALDIGQEARRGMLKKIDVELQALRTKREQQLRVQRSQQERLAQQEDQRRLAEAARIEEEKLTNLIDRVRALMEAGRHGDDAAFGEAQQVAQVAIDLRPGEGSSTAARFSAEAYDQLRRTFRLRALREDRYLDTLHQVELSHVPFPDEPPIRFPPAQEWYALSQRRKKWASVDLRKSSPREERIEAALNERTEVDFVDYPLSEALEYLRDYHGIEIWIDRNALQEEGIDPSKPVNLQLSGITLRSCLRLLLEPEGLTYAIQDEVMKITTQAKADEALSVRVYPVADLVIPIISGGFGGGAGMGAGIFGNPLGGGMGGMGMGGMGMGGMGMGGMGMGGMGGGFFSIPADDTLPAKKNIP
ncbi:MAG: hypothetical protein KatS3mg114_1335 [Planctomycetaceae bacterium]|nr:MAG: hypothetical protein KatS3mg114_1335 [Planctomycetaceae bacterium]